MMTGHLTSQIRRSLQLLELPFDRQHRYYAFVDPAGGGADEFCLTIGHKEDDDTVVDDRPLASTKKKPGTTSGRTHSKYLNRYLNLPRGRSGSKF